MILMVGLSVMNKVVRVLTLEVTETDLVYGGDSDDGDANMVTQSCKFFHWR